MSVITKKNEKIEATVAAMPKDYSITDFVAKFQQLFPKDWDRIEKSYRDHERKTKAGKSHPMPEPEQYLRNALNVWLKGNNT